MAVLHDAGAEIIKQQEEYMTTTEKIEIWAFTAIFVIGLPSLLFASQRIWG